MRMLETINGQTRIEKAFGWFHSGRDVISMCSFILCKITIWYYKKGLSITMTVLYSVLVSSISYCS